MQPLIAGIQPPIAGIQPLIAGMQPLIAGMQPLIAGMQPLRFLKVALLLLLRSMRHPTYAMCILGYICQPDQIGV